MRRPPLLLVARRGFMREERVTQRAAPASSLNLAGLFVVWLGVIGLFNGGALTQPVLQTAYDAAGNVVSVTDALGNTAVTAYDNANRPAYVFTPAVNYFVPSTGAGLTRYLVKANVYDANSNVVAVWSGNSTTQTTTGASLNRRTAFNTYDALNRLVSTTDAAGITVSYNYDEAGNRVKLTDGLNHATTFTYDGLNRLLTTTDPLGHVSGFGYDALNKTSRTDGKGQVTAYNYDIRNRLTGVVYVGSPASINIGGNVPVYPTLGRTMRYDRAGNLVEVAESYSNNSTVSNVAYAYDGLNRLVAENEGGTFAGNFDAASFGGLPSNLSGGFTNAYTYDLAGNRLTATYGAGRGDERILTSTYDDLNRLNTLVEDGRTSTYRYDRAGHRVQLVETPGATTYTTYDALGRQTSITGSGYNYNLAYDEFTNLKKQTEAYSSGHLSARIVTLGYDNADRLTSEAIVTGTTTATSTYTYDNADNRLTKIVTQKVGSAATVTMGNLTYSYNAGNELLAWHNTLPLLNGFVYDYDANGCTVGIGYDGNTYLNTSYYQGSGLHYDFENRLVGMNPGVLYQTGLTSSAGGVYSYAYDYRTRRVLRNEYAYHQAMGTVVDVNTQTSVLFSGGTSVREYGNGSLTLAPTVEYVRGSDWGGGVGGILYSLRNNAPSYYHYDGRGDVVAQSNANNYLIYQSAYVAFGQHSTGPIGLDPNTPVAYGAQEWGATLDRQRANTKEEDPTGLKLEGMRYTILDGVDRFATPDPAGFVDRTNRYVYVRNNPWTHYDPLGLANETFGGDNWFMNNIVPDPVAEYHAGQASADQMASGGTASQKAAGALGWMGHGVMVLVACIPGEGFFEKGIVKGVENGAEHILENTGRQDAEKIAAQKAKAQMDQAAAANADAKASAAGKAPGGGAKGTAQPAPKPPEATPKGDVGADTAKGAARPDGVPDHYVEKPTKKGDGTIYSDPNNPHDNVKSMDGNPNSPNPAQQQPYVVQKRDGKAFDAAGNKVDPASPEAHQPTDQFQYKPKE